MKPITPDEVVNKKKSLIPDYVIECFNKAIAKNWDGNFSIILQDEIVSAICSAGNINRQVMFNQHYLDVESIFEEAGWNVEYRMPTYCEFEEVVCNIENDKPGHSKIYDAEFHFTKKKQ